MAVSSGAVAPLTRFGLATALVTLLLAPASEASPRTHESGKVLYARSLHDRSIEAYQTGDRHGRRVLVFGSIHGDETAGIPIAGRLIAAPVTPGTDIWVVPDLNPDGTALHRRQNGDGIDLNRNFPYRWRRINVGTSTYSGPSAASEPETKALMAFITKVNPRITITFHQPLFGVGSNAKRMDVVRALAAGIQLPVKSYSCTSVCYGSFTSWVNHRTDGVAVTVEFGPHASKKRIRRAARTVLSVGSSL